MVHSEPFCPFAVMAVALAGIHNKKVTDVTRKEQVWHVITHLNGVGCASYKFSLCVCTVER